MKVWDKLQEAESKVVARVRAAIFLFGAMGGLEAHHIAEELAIGPGAELWLRRLFIVCMGLSLLLRAGQKNDEKDLGPK